jgi:hypothetical protein
MMGTGGVGGPYGVRWTGRSKRYGIKIGAASLGSNTKKKSSDMFMCSSVGTTGHRPR